MIPLVEIKRAGEVTVLDENYINDEKGDPRHLSVILLKRYNYGRRELLANLLPYEKSLTNFDIFARPQ